MTERPKFFFETDEPAEDLTLFNALKDTGVIQDAEQKVVVDTAMKRLTGKLVTIEYGTFQQNYSIQIVPTSDRKNLKNDEGVRRALMDVIPILNRFVPQTLHVNIFLPKPDWQIKLVSLVIVDGAEAWNLDRDRLESEAIPAILKAVESVVIRL